MRKPRVLLVDDEVGITRSLSLYLTENSDCEVRAENVGSRALATAHEFRPDVIVLDLVMPDADGASLAADMQSDPRLKASSIVFLTALVSPQEVHGASMEIAGHPFFAKPVDPDAVLDYIEKHAAR